MKNCFKNLLYIVKKIFLSVLLVLPLTAGARSLYPGQFAGCRAVPDKVRTAVECFDLGEVRLLPGRFMDNMLRDSAWMASVDAGRLLHSFRTNAGVFPPGRCQECFSKHFINFTESIPDLWLTSPKTYGMETGRRLKCSIGLSSII